MREANSCHYRTDLDTYVPSLITHPAVTLIVATDTGDLDQCGEHPEDPHAVGDDRGAHIPTGVYLIEDVRTYIHRDDPQDLADPGRIHGFAYRSTACDWQCAQAALLAAIDSGRATHFRVTLHLGAL